MLHIHKCLIVFVSHISSSGSLFPPARTVLHVQALEILSCSCLSQKSYHQQILRQNKKQNC